MSEDARRLNEVLDKLSGCMGALNGLTSVGSSLARQLAPIQRQLAELCNLIQPMTVAAAPRPGLVDDPVGWTRTAIEGIHATVFEALYAAAEGGDDTGHIDAIVSRHLIEALLREAAWCGLAVGDPGHPLTDEQQAAATRWRVQALRQLTEMIKTTPNPPTLELVP